jgi:hypothetical protein
MPRGIFPRRVKRHAVTQPQGQSYRLIPLTQGQTAFVDVKDFYWLSKFNWFAQFDPRNGTYYALRHTKHGKIWMHKEILQCSQNEEGDHKNHQTLDNRRHNLRKCIHSQNGKNKNKHANNTSGFIGVTWCNNRWYAYITVKGRRKHLGAFTSKEAAAGARDDAAKKHFGEFAHLNFP